MSVDFSVVADGFVHAFSLHNLLWLAIGVILGLIAGTLPGFSGGSMMAVVLPLIITLPIDTMLITLAAIYAANVYSDSTTGILYNIPGGAAGIPASVEGYQLRLRGRLLDAFSAQVSGSFVGAIIGFLVLLLLVPTFLYFVKFFGSGERALLAVWALIFIASGVITKEDPLRAFLSVGVGLALALVGQQPNIGTFRYTLGLSGLWDGLAVVLLVLGLFAIPQLLAMIGMRSSFAQESRTERIPFWGLYASMGRVLLEGWRVVVRSSLFGVFVGVIPGIGTTTAAWAGYATAQTHTRLPDKFGEGNRDGVLGAESASNACEVGTIIPLLALGIPGSAGAAIMLGSLTLVGINPGPAMYATHGAQVWTIMFGIGLSGVMFTLLAYPFIRGAQFCSNLSVPILIGAIGTLSVMGAYLQSHDLFGAVLMMVLGVITIFLSLLGLRPSAILIGFVLGPSIEKELIRGYQIGGIERFLKPTALVILAVILITVLLALFRHVREKRAQAENSVPEIPSDEDPTLASDRPGGFLKEKLLAVLGLLFAGYLLFETLQYPLFASLWVYVVAGGFIITPCVLMLVRNIRYLPDAIAGFQKVREDMVVDWGSIRSQAIVVFAFLAFIALLIPLGFIVSCTLFTFGLCLVFDRNLPRAVLSGLGVGLAMYLVCLGFSIYMPHGIFNI
ncbi:tripartite tricarboxylate transporter permease [Rhizobium binxianense]